MLIFEAPELFEEHTKHMKESDVYAFGVVCFEIASRCFPWASISSASIPIILSKGRREEIPKETPSSFSQLIGKCWDQNPSNRLTFSQIIEELKGMSLNVATTKIGATPSYVTNLPVATNLG